MSKACWHAYRVSDAYEGERLFLNRKQSRGCETDITKTHVHTGRGLGRNGRHGKESQIGKEPICSQTLSSRAAIF
jgi:hypothetical protein